MGEPRWRGAGARSLVGRLGWHRGTVVLQGGLSLGWSWGGLRVAGLSSWGPVHKRAGSASCKAERNEKGQGEERGGTWCSPTFSPHQAANPLIPSSSSFFFF